MPACTVIFQFKRWSPIVALVAAGSVLLPLLGPARAEPPASDKPFPMIEAGMHTAIIKRIGVDRAGRYAVTASDDKTARLWDLQTGRQLAVLRVPVGPGHEGKLYAAALSPDGALVALGGYTGPAGQPQAIYLLDRASGRLLQRLPGLPNVAFHLAFSADGRRLAAALGAGGVQVFERGGGGRWQLLAADSFDRGSHSVAFAADGRLLAVEEMDPSSQAPGELRLYAPPSSPRLALLARRSTSGGKNPLSARFSPDGRRIAVGFADTTAVDIVDGATLAPIASADRQGLLSNGVLGNVAWSADGRRLFAAGRYFVADGSSPLVLWSAFGGPPTPVALGLTDVVMDLLPLADGRLVFAGGDPAWGMLGPDLRPRLFLGPPVLDHRGYEGHFDAFRLAPDGRWLEFRAVARSASGRTSRLARFDLAERRLLFPAAAAPGGLAPRRSGLPIDGWQNTIRPTLAGQPLPLEPFETSRSLAVDADGGRFALGSDWAVQLFDRSGQSLWRTSVPGAAWLVNLSADGRYVLAAIGDGSIRWYRSSDGTLALSLFVHPDSRWLLWTPEGFYDGSPASATAKAGASLLGYHLNQGRDREPTFVEADQLQQNFFRPDLIARRLAGDEGPITAAVARVGDVRQLLRAADLPPQIRLIGTPQRLASGEVEITYELIDRGGGIGAVETRLNGAVIEGRANPPVAGINRRRLLLPKGKVLAQLRVNGRSGVASLPVTFEIEGAPALEPPTLHVLAVGVTAYRDTTLRQGVKFAAADAEALVATLRRPGLLAGARLGTVIPLTDADASRDRIRQELQAMAAVVKPGDRFVLYLAGHGTAVDGQYYFLTPELDNGGEAAVRSQALSGDELRGLLAQIQAGGTLLLFDTCSSGTYGSSAQLDLKNAVRRFELLDGRLMLAAAGDRQMALESPFGQRGIFTTVVIDGLLGKADASRDRVVKATELLTYVLETVPEVTQRQFQVRQDPYGSFQGGGTFPLTRVGGGAP
jgi:WD40 repeat protein